jgi:hypothetical protein
MSEPESNSESSLCWVGIFTPHGELVKKIESFKRIYHCTEVIDPKTLEPGVYHIVIQHQEMIMVDSLLVPYSAKKDSE